MTAPMEDRLRVVLREMADEVRPSPPPAGLEQRAAVAERRRLALPAVAVVAAFAVAVGAVALLRDPRREFNEPAERPPKIFKLSETATSTPGRSLVAVLASTPGAVGGRALQLQPALGGPAVALATSDWVATAYSQQLSWDGTRVIRQFDSEADPRLEIVNLEDGRTNRLRGLRGTCPQLSPDNRRVAFTDTNDRLAVADARTGRVLWRRGHTVGSCNMLGWSPDGRLLMAPGDPEARVLDDRGRVVDRLGQKEGVNAGMSWSPNGHSLLLYDGVSGRYLIRDVTSGSERVTQPPAGALKALGWAGSRIVWLVGEPGDQRLVTTNEAGDGPRLWMRIDAGDRPVDTVQWSRDLSGRPVGED